MQEHIAASSKYQEHALLGAEHVRSETKFSQNLWSKYISWKLAQL